MTSVRTICFYDETLKKQIEGFYKYDGKAIHVSTYGYGARSTPPLVFRSWALSGSQCTAAVCKTDSERAGA